MEGRKRGRREGGRKEEREGGRKRGRREGGREREERRNSQNRWGNFVPRTAGGLSVKHCLWMVLFVEFGII